MKKRPITVNQLLTESRKLLKQYIYKYLLFVIPVFIIELTVLLLMLLVDNEVGQKVGIVFVALDAIITITYFFIFDFDPARRLRKANFVLKNSKITKQQGIVFYNFLKFRLVACLPINLVMIASLVVVTVVVFI